MILLPFRILQISLHHQTQPIWLFLHLSLAVFGHIDLTSILPAATRIAPKVVKVNGGAFESTALRYDLPLFEDGIQELLRPYGAEQLHKKDMKRLIRE